MKQRKSEKSRVVVAGHICLDITPTFPEKEVRKVEEMLIPGRLIQMGTADVHMGGAVANTGLALKILGADVALMGKIGKDAFGELVYSQMKSYDAHHGMIVSENTDTSYSVVVAPRGIDRIFLHHSGANDAFYYDDLDFELIGEADLFHFGYPPLMKSIYTNGGEELIRIFRKVKSLGVATSLDMAAVDEYSESGAVDWEAILKKVLPFVDFFVPSVEELAYMIDRPRYNEWVKRAAGRDLTSILDIERDVRPLAEKLLTFGAKVLLIKCGAPGLYFATSEMAQLNEIPCTLPDSWSNIRHFEKSYKPEKILSGTGAGDTSIAAFLYAVLQEHSWQECLQLAAATGASCVSAYDALSGLKQFETLQEMIQNGWEKNE